MYIMYIYLTIHDFIYIFCLHTSRSKSHVIEKKLHDKADHGSIPNYSTDGELSVNVGSLQPWLAAKRFGS